jgi:hypothetical protein
MVGTGRILAPVLTERLVILIHVGVLGGGGWLDVGRAERTGGLGIDAETLGKILTDSGIVLLKTIR